MSTAYCFLFMVIATSPLFPMESSTITHDRAAKSVMRKLANLHATIRCNDILQSINTYLPKGTPVWTYINFKTFLSDEDAAFIARRIEKKFKDGSRNYFDLEETFPFKKSAHRSNHKKIKLLLDESLHLSLLKKCLHTVDTKNVLSFTTYIDYLFNVKLKETLKLTDERKILTIVDRFSQAFDKSTLFSSVELNMSMNMHALLVQNILHNKTVEEQLILYHTFFSHVAQYSKTKYLNHIRSTLFLLIAGYILTRTILPESRYFIMFFMAGAAKIMTEETINKNFVAPYELVHKLLTRNQ